MAPSPERRIRVGVVIPFYHPVTGGAENQCRALLRELSAAGEVVFPWLLTRRKEATLAAEEIIDGVRVVRLDPPGISRRAHYLFYLRLFWRLQRVGREVDLLHCHATSLTGLCALLAGRLRGKPVILKLSSSGELRGPITGTTAVRGRLTQRLRGGISRYLCRHAATVALTGEGLAELQQFAARQPVLIPNGVDTRRFAPATHSREELRHRLDLPRESVILIFSGRLIECKGLDLLLDAVAALAADGSDPLLCVLGTGAGQADSVEALVRSRVGTRIRHVPHTDRVEEYLQAADLFVMPSRREGLPNAVLEALAVGLPCVLSDIAPHRELAAANPAAEIRLFPSGDPAALADTLRQRCRELKGERAAGGGKRSSLGEDYRLETVARRYLDLYRELAHVHR